MDIKNLPENSMNSTVAALARQADLPLTEERISVVASILHDWNIAANELSRRMSAEQYQAITPITGLRHDHQHMEV